MLMFCAPESSTPAIVTTNMAKTGEILIGENFGLVRLMVRLGFVYG
jgi:hypothetical protein